MKVVVVTTHRQSIYVDIIKVIDEILYYKENLNDRTEKWKSLSRSNVSHIQVKDMKSF